MPDSAKTFERFLKEHGLIDADIKKIEDVLPTVFELSHAFNAWTLGDAAIQRLGMTDQAGKPGFDLLTALGLTKAQVAALNRVICGTQTVEGAPHLKDEHLPVFDCASTCGPTGKRYIAPDGHIRMMAAAQPFISGAISKTINLPNSASVQDIKDAYRMSWELGLKANALYRDGCKLSQVLNNKSDADEEVEDEEAIEAAKEEVAIEVTAVAEAASAAVSKSQPAPDRQPVEKIIERIVERPLRRRLPDTRMGKTHKFNVAGHEGYLTVGLYEDGTPGELFITMAKEGSTIGGLMDSLGTAISVALQYGVPVESLVNKFTHQRFEPAGITHNPEIPFAKSLVDYIFRWLGMEFVPGYRAANAPARSKPQPEPKQAERVASETGEGANGNGHGNGGRKSPIHPKPAPLGANEAVTATAAAVAQAFSDGQRSALVSAMSQMQADAPACDACGTITVRNGTCYKCLNCGASMGCS
jgi:ribonucleoside-diphosphate reductase alpha chain